jgi:hypothetical protein
MSDVCWLYFSPTFFLAALGVSLRPSGEDRVSNAMESTASNMAVLHAEVKAASRAISQTIVASGAHDMVGLTGRRGHARVLHDFGPAAFAGARGGGKGAGEAETADMMVSGLRFLCVWL